MEYFKVVEKLKREEEFLWLNPQYEVQPTSPEAFDLSDVTEAENRWQRFAPLLKKLFRELEESQGIIESPLREIPRMKQKLSSKLGRDFFGRWFCKLDSELPIAGSVKARGGIYEVLSIAEELAQKAGLLSSEDSYEVLAEKSAQELFSDYKIQVGSTGNLGLSIGTMAAKLGFQAMVHMSRDAAPWKKDRLRAKGATVIEYEEDYSVAVQQGRQASQADSHSFFIDDENSKKLFLGYATAALRLKKQLDDEGVKVTQESPLVVVIPCGVGGAPGGITFGLKQIYGSKVIPFFVEPTKAPAMLLGLASGQHEKICVRDIGLSGKTLADGLAVGRPSALVSPIMADLLAGVLTVRDEHLAGFVRTLYQAEGIFIEPSAAASFALTRHQALLETLASNSATVIFWATGGSLVPEAQRGIYLD